MEQIIKEAIQGGWDGTDEYGGEYTMQDFLYSKEKLLLDPLFWQALGKSRGWLKYTRDDGCSADSPDIEKMPNQGWMETWIKNALKFHEINLTQGFEKAVEWLSVKE